MLPTNKLLFFISQIRHIAGKYKTRKERQYGKMV